MIMNNSPIGITSVVSLTCNGNAKKLFTPISKISDQVNSRCCFFDVAIGVILQIYVDILLLLQKKIAM